MLGRLRSIRLLSYLPAKERLPLRPGTVVLDERPYPYRTEQDYSQNQRHILCICNQSAHDASSLPTFMSPAKPPGYWPSWGDSIFSFLALQERFNCKNPRVLKMANRAVETQFRLALHRGCVRKWWTMWRRASLPAVEPVHPCPAERTPSAVERPEDRVCRGRVGHWFRAAGKHALYGNHGGLPLQAVRHFQSHPLPPLGWTSTGKTGQLCPPVVGNDRRTFQ